MRILVSGGFGFLGTHLVEELLRHYGRAAEIQIVDNLSTNPIPHERFLDEIGRPAQVRFAIQDIHEFCLQAGEQRWDAIFHLASVVGPAGVLPYAGRMSYLILRDCQVISDLAIRCGAKLIDVSTSEIYGGGQEGLCLESYPRIITANYSARLEYAVGKLASEVSLVNLTRTTPLHAVIVRPFNISGPRQSGKGGFVLPRFIGQALTGRDLTVFGNGSQVRAFTHVRDMAHGIVLAAERGQSGSAYNLGNIANKVSILQLAEAVREIVNPKVKIISVDPKKIYGPLFEEANDKYPDATLATQELGWVPKHSFTDVIRDTYQYMSRMPTADLEATIGKL